MAGPVYSLTFVNNTSTPGTGVVYQTSPNLPPGTLSLAWLSKNAMPATRVLFQWTIDYGFVWSETGQLRPGVVFTPSQYWQADLSSSNQVTFTQQGPGFFTFTNQTAGPQQGSLFIQEDNTITFNQAAVGIGMSNNATFAVQAMPNMNLAFAPRPQYWITFGNYQQGQVLDVNTISNQAQVTFPAGVYSMTATLNQDHTWTVQPSG